MNEYILWIEDRKDTILEQIELCESYGFNVKICSKTHRILDIIEKDINNICLIIVDIMLYGVYDLKEIDKPFIKTQNGYTAGNEIIDNLFRPDKDIFNENLKDIPILIISSKFKYDQIEEFLTMIQSRGGSWIKFIEKGGIDKQSGIIWTEQFRIIIEDLKKGLSD